MDNNSQTSNPEQKVEINRRIDSLKFKENKKGIFNIEGQGMDEKTWNEKRKIQEAGKFYGNMGQPETPTEFKARHGVWPPGYDEHGNKI
jgi:hypothetical protein